MKRTILFTMVFLLITITGVPAEESFDNQPNLTGFWTINKKMSDDLQQVMMEAMGGGKGSGRGGGGGGGRGGGGGGHPGGSADMPQNSKAKQPAEEMIKQYSRLEIFHDGHELNVTNGLDITRLLYTDGRTNNIWTQRGEATATASWVGSTLVVKWNTRQETVARVRYYSLEKGEKRLFVSEEIQLPGKDELVKVKMVYDR